MINLTKQQIVQELQVKSITQLNAQSWVLAKTIKSLGINARKLYFQRQKTKLETK